MAAEKLAEAAVRETWIREKGLTVFSLRSPLFPGLEVDLFVAEPFDFDATFDRAVRVRLDEITAPVVSLGDLLALKRAAGRPIDLADVAALEAIADAEDAG